MTGARTDPQGQVPAPGQAVLDHLAHWVPDHEAAGRRLAALGFALTPFSHQVTRPAPDAPPVSAGTANQCMMFEDGYIEILTVTGDTPNAATLRRGMDRYVGVHLIAFGSGDSALTTDALRLAGFDPLPAVRLSRDIETESGAPGQVRFSVVRLAPDAMAEGRIQYCQHLTPENMWQRRWLSHPNGAVALRSIAIASADPDEAADRFQRFTGKVAMRRTDGAHALALDRGLLLIGTADWLQGLVPGAEVPALPCIAAYGIAVADLEAARSVLAKGGVATRSAGLGTLIADGGPDLGGTIVFSAAAAQDPWTI